ncbi:DUF1800 domain-containing protein [Pilimelia columellifera]|uniref:DUF1800 domain-containing protein n=1 Tax=Pilimelia columellifera subsp. columellifera TaxID=706583 RepID=A0ABP6B039_9ACTN
MTKHSTSRRNVLTGAAAAGLGVLGATRLLGRPVTGAPAGGAAMNGAAGVAALTPSAAPLTPSATPLTPSAAPAGTAAAAGLPTASANTTGTTLASGLVDADPLTHLLRRATYGATPESLTEVRTLGAAAWIERQLDPAAIADPVCDDLLTRLPMARMTITQVRGEVTAGRMVKYGWEAMYQVGYAAVARAAWSRRQLFEVMVDFWSNHLNVTCPFDQGWDNRPDYDRAVIRPHTLGRFADMLKASAKHPAMLNYLDNRSSTKTRPNENYARELMELHTVGLIHTEDDVQNAARLLTGLTTDTNNGLYRYSSTSHAVGAVKVLGFSHANSTAGGGEAAAMAMLDHLASHPATAARLARKLCVRFVADDPPQPLVDRLAAVYLANGTAIKPVLRELFRSAEFAAAAGGKVRTPYEGVIATIRALGLAPEQKTVSNPGWHGLRSLYWMVDSLGQAPMAWHPPNGYPDVAAAWASPAGLLGRWNENLNLAAGWWPKQLTRPASMLAHLAGPLPATYGGLVDALTRRLLGVVVAERHRTALAAFYGKTPGSALRATDAAATWAFPYLVALILDSPYFQAR